MLTELHITNFALVDSLRLEVGPGFSVLTGETGAGKSIIVDAMGAALGERTGTEVVRTGAEKASVEAVFDLADSPAAAQAATEFGFEPEDGLLILGREISRGGRSQCRINGRPTTTAVMREITTHLIDIHGQHEHQSLLCVPLHIGIFDDWCGNDVLKLKQSAQALHVELAGIVSERERLQTDQRERARLLDLYNFQAEEINAAAPQPGEEEELAAERNRLANAERLYAAALEISASLGSETGAVDGLSTAAAMAEKIAQMDPSMGGLLETLNSALFSAQEAVLAVRDYQDDIEANPERLEQIEERLDMLRTLKRKYGDTLDEVISYGSRLAAKIDELTNSDERAEELTGRIESLTSQLIQITNELTKRRRAVAPAFQSAVETQLADLAMGRTKFEVSIVPIEPGANGADAVEFLISPNPGEPVKPLAKIASGGEMSRIMLALKSAAKQAEVPTLVFDEIDTGIGGRTAQVLGDKLASLAKSCQVMCVTHLPQVASKAARHFSVDKVVEGGRSYIRLRTLESEERVKELARMLGADEGSAAAQQHAREMLTLADKGNG